VNERLEREVKMTLLVLQPIAIGLRSRGYDATIWVEHRERDAYTVEIRVAVPPVGIPIEFVEAQA
jgi:hypothetical protein